MRLLPKIKVFIFPVLGVICILFAEHVTFVLPYLLGGAMALVSALMGIDYFANKKFISHQADELAYGIILLIMGVVFIIQGSNALGPLGTTWAIIGIRKASKSLNHAIRQFYIKQHFMAPVAEFFVRITLALILLFHPFEKFTTHVVILGLELIAVSIRFKKPFLPTWDTPA